MSARKLFCVLAAVTLLGHGVHLLLTGDTAPAQAATGKPAATAKPAKKHPWLCRLVGA
jgi:hypothetical protein